ncbi:MAG: ECF-type sigma factor [Planctomycetota bacterium]
MAEQQVSQPDGEGGGADPDKVFADLYAALRQLAAGYMRGQHAAHTLQATALVHEAWVRLHAQDPGRWDRTEHVMAVAARAMRQVLVDHARTRGRKKRKREGKRVPLEDIVEHFDETGIDLLDFEEALRELEAEDEVGARAVRVVELRFFCGLGMEGIAEVTGMPLRTVERDYKTARLWLQDRLA